MTNYAGRTAVTTELHALLATHRDRQEREIERLRAENDALAEALAAVDRAIEAGRNE